MARFVEPGQFFGEGLSYKDYGFPSLTLARKTSGSNRPFAGFGMKFSVLGSSSLGGSAACADNGRLAGSYLTLLQVDVGPHVLEAMSANP
jgi:hypothetical protein